MRLRTLQCYYASVWLLETDEIMHPYGYRKLMRSRTVHNYYAPAWLPESDEIMNPAELLCTRTATGK